MWKVRASPVWLGTKLAFEFLVPPTCRSGEVRGGRWAEIDLNARMSLLGCRRSPQTPAGPSRGRPRTGPGVSARSAHRQMSWAGARVLPLPCRSGPRLRREPCTVLGTEEPHRTWSAIKTFGRPPWPAAASGLRDSCVSRQRRVDSPPPNRWRYGAMTRQRLEPVRSHTTGGPLWPCNRRESR